MCMRKTRSVRFNHMSVPDSGCFLPIRMASVGAIAHPIMRCLASMVWLGCDTFFTEHVAIFGEYKYNRATFNFDNAVSEGAAGGLRGDYSVHNIVGGLSFHF